MRPFLLCLSALLAVLPATAAADKKAAAALPAGAPAPRGVLFAGRTLRLALPALDAQASLVRQVEAFLSHPAVASVLPQAAVADARTLPAVSPAQALAAFADAAASFDEKALHEMPREQVHELAARLWEGMRPLPAAEPLEEATERALAGELSEWVKVNSGGYGMSVSKFGTKVYYPPHARALPGYPELAEGSKAVLIFFGGAGSIHGSGRNMMRDANVYKRYGVNVIGFDYPFHGQGPTDARWKDIREFKKMAFALIKHYRRCGLPVYLAGHSFGPMVIQELLHDSPGLARGAVLLSPGGDIAPALGRRYRWLEKSGALNDYVKFNGISWDAKSEAWSDAIQSQLKANRGTRHRSRIPVLVVAGDEDPWSTPEEVRELADTFPNSELEIWAGVSHHTIFTVRGRRQTLLIERMLRFIEENGAGRLEEAPPAEGASLRFAYYHANSALFRRFASESRLRLERMQEERRARQALEAFGPWLKAQARRLAAAKLARYGGLARADEAARRAWTLLETDDAVLAADADVTSLIQFATGQ